MWYNVAMSGNSKYKSIRIPLDGYNYLKSLSQANHRTIVAEIMLIISEHKSLFKKKPKPKENELSEKEIEEKMKTFNELRGIIKGLPPGNYAENIDELLYGGKELSDFYRH